MRSVNEGACATGSESPAPRLFINDKPCFSREWFDESPVRTRCVVVGIHVANYPAGHLDDHRTRLAEHSIRQVYVAVACVAQLSVSHVNILASPRSEGPEISLSRSHTATADHGGRPVYGTGRSVGAAAHDGAWKLGFANAFATPVPIWP